MAVNINQFALTTDQGRLDLTNHGSVITAQVSASQATPLVPGQAVVLEDSAGGMPKVLAATSATDRIFGFVAANMKDISFPAYQAVEIARVNSVMWMTASAAIARNANVEVVIASNKVAAAGDVNTVVGYAIDKATADGDLIRVWINDALAYAPRVNNNVVTATLAEINAGKVIVPAVAGKQLLITSYIARVSGTFATGTAVILQSSNASPVLVTTLAEAGLTNGAVLTVGSANTTLGAGFGIALGAGDSLRVVNSGSAQTGGTNITFTITYDIL